LPPENDAVVQTKRAFRPELEIEWQDPVADPIRRPGCLPKGKFCGVFGGRFFERESALKRPRLLARPGADPGLQRATCKIGIGIGIADERDRSAETDLPAHRFP